MTKLADFMDYLHLALLKEFVCNILSACKLILCFFKCKKYTDKSRDFP